MNADGRPNVPAMAKARAEAEELLGSAVDWLCEPLDEDATPEHFAMNQETVTGYLHQLRWAVERFEEAARAT